jgi:large subunit ribosomal protein L10
MKNREDKKKDFEELRKALEAANNVFVTGYEKMTVDQDYNLRKTVRGAGGNTRSSRTTLRRSPPKVCRRAGAEGSEGYDVAGVDVGRSGGARQGAHRLREDESGVHFQGGPGGRPRDRYQSDRELANMPPKEEIFAKLLYLINAPAQRLVTAMGAVGAIWRW